MLRDSSLALKISLGFGATIIMLLLVAWFGVQGLNQTEMNAKEVISSNMISRMIAQRELDHLKWVEKLNAFLNDIHVHELTVQTDHHKCGFGKWYYGEERKEVETLVPAMKEKLKEIGTPHKNLHASAIQIKELNVKADVEFGKFLAEKKNDHLAWMHKVKDVLMDAEKTKTGVQMDYRLCGLGKWFFSDKVQSLIKEDPEMGALIGEIEGPHRDLHRGAANIEKLLGEGKRQEAIDYFRRKTEKSAMETLEAINEVIRVNDNKIKKSHQAKQVFFTQTMPALKDVQSIFSQLNNIVRRNMMTDEKMLNAASDTRNRVFLWCVIAIFVAIGFAAGITYYICSVLRKVIATLRTGSREVTGASNQLAENSQQMAESASEQASSLEEISSSIEEMSSMVNKNAKNTEQVQTLMNESIHLVEKGQSSMENLDISINDIQASSKQTMKILKTIDEIAFQTNLLALNAAVEAARAGEAGKGFAVVAEEVRGLARRSAEAAKSTSELLSKGQSSTQRGVDVAAEVREFLLKIIDSSRKVSNLVNDVTQASIEQAQGISHLNDAVTQMDQATQRGAADSEESAAASEELSGQAHELNDMVNYLNHFVDGGRGHRRHLGDELNASKSADDFPLVRIAQPSPKVSRAVQEEDTVVIDTQIEEEIPETF